MPTDAQGHEQGGIRPALVVSNDAYNRTPHGLVLLVPITGTLRGIPSHIVIEPPEGGLTRRSVAMCEQVQALSVGRLRQRRGAVTGQTLERVRQVIGMFIDR